MNQEERPYLPFDTFVLRTPFFPFSFFTDITAGERIDGEKFREICARPEVREAIRVASPDLYADLDRWLAGDLDDKKKVERLQQSMLRYLLRMSTRSTPFGLFAGFSTGRIGEETRVALTEPQAYGRHTRLDMNYLCSLGQNLARIPIIRDAIRYFPNSSIYRVGDQVRYVEYRYQNKRRVHHIIAVDHTDYLQKILDAAAAGKKADELAALLVDDEITMDEAREFIIELIDSQVLVNDLEPAITGPEFLHQILQVLDPIAGTEEIRTKLLGIDTIIREIDASPIGATTAQYDRIQEELKSLNTEYDVKYLFQADMVKPVIQADIERTVADDILKGIDLMNRISPRPRETMLDKFREAFYERFETREVPLLLALDLECGIGYRPSESRGDDSPLVMDIGSPQPAQAGREIYWDGMQSFLLKKLIEVREKQGMELELTDEDFKTAQPNWNDLPDTMATMVRIVAGKSGDQDRPRIYMSGSGGSGAANLLGRFCHADDNLLAFTRQITAREQELNPEVVFAEIVHLPESRTGNILLRPVIRPHEIPYLARAAVEPDFQIRVADLFLSVRGNRLVLRSRRLNREIMPRLSTAHNYSFNSIPVYHFLCDFQHQGRRSGVGFGWGNLENEFPFLPRVVYRNLIFSFARWRINKPDIKHLYEEKDDRKLLESVRAWREKIRLPNRVFLDDSDNELVIDLENIDCIRNLLAVTKNRPNFQLEELLFDADTSITRAGNEAFLNEFIFTFHRRQAVEKPRIEAANESE